MPDDLQELQDSLTPAGDGSAVNNPNPESVREQTVPKSEVDKLYARMKQAEESAKKLREELATKVTTPAMSQDVLKRIEKVELTSQGYKPEEADFILRSGGNPNDPYVKAGIETLRAKVGVEQAQPAASQVAAPASSQDIPIHKMKAEEKSKAWREALDKAASRRAAGQVV